jgi:hypothetical protein
VRGSVHVHVLCAVVLVTLMRWRWFSSMKAEMVLNKRMDVLKVDLYHPGRYWRPGFGRCY